MAKHLPQDAGERYPWRETVQTVAVETPQPTLPTGPVVLLQTANVTKYNLILVEFSRDRKNWTVKQRSKHHSASRLFLREKPVSLRIMILARDPDNESTREITKVTRDVSEAVPLSYEQHLQKWSRVLAGQNGSSRSRRNRGIQNGRTSRSSSLKSWTTLYLRTVFGRRM